MSSLWWWWCCCCGHGAFIFQHPSMPASIHPYRQADLTCVPLHTCYVLLLKKYKYLHPVHHSTLLYHYSTLHYITLHYITAQHSTAQHSTVHTYIQHPHIHAIIHRPATSSHSQVSPGGSPGLPVAFRVLNALKLTGKTTPSAYVTLTSRHGCGT